MPEIRLKAFQIRNGTYYLLKNTQNTKDMKNNYEIKKQKKHTNELAPLDT